MTTADHAQNAKQRDKLTIAEVCADLGISRRTFYEWRAKTSQAALIVARRNSHDAAAPSPGKDMTA